MYTIIFIFSDFTRAQTWYAFEGPLGDVIHNGRFFFAWKEGCLMGTYNTLEEATASLTSGEARETH